MIDTHSHINFEEYKSNFDEFIEDLKNNDIENVIIPGVEPSSFDEIISYCENYDMLYGAIGIHPSEWQTYSLTSEKRIKELLNHKKVVAMGEIGLDFFYGSDEKEEQKNILIKQLEIAREFNVPVIIHDRDSHEDVFNILKDFKLKDVIFHCFSGDKEFAKQCLNEGYYIAVGGIVTFKNASVLQEAVKIIPLDRLLLETDAPYLSPVPYRGKINSPKYLKYIVDKIAQLKETETEIIKNQTTINAKKVFNIK